MAGVIRKTHCTAWHRSASVYLMEEVIVKENVYRKTSEKGSNNVAFVSASNALDTTNTTTRTTINMIITTGTATLFSVLIKLLLLFIIILIVIVVA